MSAVLRYGKEPRMSDDAFTALVEAIIHSRRTGCGDWRLRVIISGRVPVTSR